MIIFTWNGIFRNLKRTYQACKLHNEFENKRKCTEHRKYKKRESSLSLLLSLSLSLSVCLYLCLSVSVSVSLCLCHTHLFHSFCMKILELLFSGGNSLEGRSDDGWRVTQRDAVETDLSLQVGSLGFFLSLSLTRCELPGKSFPWVSMDSGKRLS